MTNDSPVPTPSPETMPAALLAGLFSTGIVVIPGEFEAVAPAGEPIRIPEEIAPAPPPVMPPVADIPALASQQLSWLGGFEKKILVVLRDPGALHINDKDLELLGKILGSVKLSMADIAVVNAATHALEYYALNQKLPAAIAFYFGIQPVEIGAPLKFPPFQVQPWNNTTFLYAPPLAEMNLNTPEATALKKELWTALKRIFG